MPGGRGWPIPPTAPDMHCPRCLVEWKREGLGRRQCWVCGRFGRRGQLYEFLGGVNWSSRSESPDYNLMED